MYGLLEVLLLAVVFRDATAPRCPVPSASGLFVESFAETWIWLDLKR